MPEPGELSRRWVELDGVDNMRDLGGLRVRDGATTRLGCTFRSSTFQGATSADVVAIRQLGLRTVIDLRMPAEAEREGQGLLGGDGLRIVNLPISTVEPTETHLVPDGSQVDLAVLYHAMLEGSGESVPAIARIVANPAGHPVAFHCAAGKDRTGIVAAVLLDAVGVEQDAIVADYALTTLRLDRIRQRLRSLPSYRDLSPVARGNLGAAPETMRGFLWLLHERHGGGADWLRANGLSEADLAGLRVALVGG